MKLSFTRFLGYGTIVAIGNPLLLAGESSAAFMAMTDWPLLTGAAAILLLFVTWWQQANHRRSMEQANEELQQSEKELKRAFEALRESESKFRLLFERSADAVLLLDPSKGPKFIDCNDATARLLGYRSKAEIVALQPGAISTEFQPDGSPSVPKAEEMIRRAIEQGSHRFEWRNKRGDGRVIFTEVVMTPVQVQEKPLIVTVARDITERKQAEGALLEHQQLLSSILDNISEGIYRSSASQGLIFANKAYLRMFGYDYEELAAIPRENLYSNPADRKRLLQLLTEQGGYTNQELLYKRKNGSTFWALASSIAVYHSNSQAIDYYVGAITDITERKKAQDDIQQLNQNLEQRIAERTAELAASEARLRILLEHAPEAIVVFPADLGRFVIANENAQKLYGLTREELLKLTFTDVTPGLQPNGSSSAELISEKVRDALEGKTPVFDWIHVRSDGQQIPCEVRLVQLPADGQQLIRASILDTSERRRREKIQLATYQISEAIHTAEDLESLYSQIHSIIKTLMPAENFYLALWHADTGLHHFDYYVDEMDPRPSPRLLDNGLSGYVLRTGKALLAGRGKTPELSGWPEGSGTPAAIWLGVPLGVRGITLGVMAVQDYENERAYREEEKQILTFVAEQIALAIERKRTEQALRESEQKHRALFEASSQGVLLQDEEKFIDVNPAALRILEYEREEDLLGKRPADTSSPVQFNGESPGRLAALHIQECITNSSARFEWMGRTAKGRDIPLEVILTRIQMSGRPLIQAVINDISERKKTEAELLKSLAREKELGMLKSNFVSMVSHEFRTPLGIILSSAEILEEYFDRLEPSERSEHLSSIIKNVRRMADLMEEVLLLSKVEAGKLNFEPQLIDLSGFCRRLVDEVLSATSQRCPVELQLDPLPAEANVDERLLRHILTNVLTNAIKYSPAGVAVQLSMRQELARVIFEIKDHGIGI
ncbi:MAG: PAS domain S-box protein, partial [Verrucomicrobiota bacterium]|nr:PAS domain S-box protein [Verrucomicrobiota bacterium]